MTLRSAGPGAATSAPPESSTSPLGHEVRATSTVPTGGSATLVMTLAALRLAARMAPAGPGWPGAPRGPGAPCGPTAPWGPAGPCGPTAPWGPAGPCAGWAANDQAPTPRPASPTSSATTIPATTSGPPDEGPADWVPPMARSRPNVGCPTSVRSSMITPSLSCLSSRPQPFGEAGQFSHRRLRRLAGAASHGPRRAPRPPAPPGRPGPAPPRGRGRPPPSVGGWGPTPCPRATARRHGAPPAVVAPRSCEPGGSPALPCPPPRSGGGAPAGTVPSIQALAPNLTAGPRNCSNSVTFLLS